ncbi:hypothetical protein CN266_25495 [Bacillus cereus]|uniref:hypothetical protein n=1 Tax=Bacillus cereus TaxID=1396 RepID=UPI000BF700D2|nr:hypothetical protein [Bacillus cereus]PFC60784.1 hypothetical protein CN266_25495 [Bacillus cereus]
MENKALIVGNGFSINFDYSFANIYSSLNKGKNALLKSGEFCISVGAKPDTRYVLKTNYQSVLSFVRNMNQSKLENIFNDALKFADFIVNTAVILEQLLESKYIHKLKTAPNMIEITENIAKVGKEKGIQYINIENWPVLFWIYNLIDRTPEFIEFNKSPNLFVSLMKLGETLKLCDPSTPGSVMLRTRTNGFSIFYRLLMISIVFNEGKSVNIKKLSNINNIKQEKLNKWLDEFKALFSLNYDKILEMFSHREVIHLHGKFTESKEGDIFYYSYALLENGEKYYTNDILLGDYTTTKVLDGFLHQLVMNKQAFAQQMQDPLKVLETNLQAESINHVVFFGVHPENDYHILSSIYYYFYSNQISSPEVTYCYYGDEAKLNFEVNWQNIIDNVYPKTVEYAKSIKINYLDSKSILKTYF